MNCAMMRASLLGVAFAACGAVSFGQPASATEPRFRITGILVSSVDGAPIRHGHLFYALSGRGRGLVRRFPSPDDSVGTDDQGHFVITLPSAGSWSLTADARGFTRQAYLEHEQYSSAIVLTRAEPAMDIRFALSPEAEITGVVLDEAGEPVRGALASLAMVRPPGPDRSGPAAAMRGASQTDDRGEYEFDGLAPGNYRVCVQAHPWYAATGGVRSHAGDGPSLDPSLDFAYPATCFPGTDDPDAAETLKINAGDVRQADFHLLPVPSIHLSINPPQNTAAAGVPRGVPMMPIVQRIDSDAGGQSFLSTSFNRNAQGQIDVGGLTPGLYRIQMAGPGQDNKSSVIRVTAGAARTVSFDAASNEAEVSIHVDGVAEPEADSVQVSLLDPENGRGVASSNMGGGFRGGIVRLRSLSGRVPETARNTAQANVQDDAPDRTLNVPPGQYEVVLQGRRDFYLTGITAKGAQVAGRLVTVPAGESSLLLHVADGRAALTGIATFNGKPSVGAVVMLVPATLGQPGAIQIARRDQSNTDGSFDISAVIPGQYILIAVKDGWGINWSDASTLRRYLTQGVAVDLTSPRDVKENIVVQAP